MNNEIKNNEAEINKIINNGANYITDTDDLSVEAQENIATYRMKNDTLTTEIKKFLELK